MLPCEEFFEHEGVRLRYLVWDVRGAADGDAAPVVFVHGFAQRAESWGDVARLLADDGVTSAAVDLVGHGKSDRPDDAAPYAFDWQVRALAAFLDAVPSVLGLSADVPPCLCGYSMGGRLAAGVAKVRPDAFGALVLESAGLGPADEGERARLTQRNAEWAQRVRDEGVAAFMDWWEQLPLFATQRRLAPDVRRRIREGRLANDAEALARTFELAGVHAMPSSEATVRALTSRTRLGCSVVYCAGELDEKYRAVAKRLAAASEGVIDARIVEDAGHNVHLERPEAFAQVVRAVVS